MKTKNRHSKAIVLSSLAVAALVALIGCGAAPGADENVDPFTSTSIDPAQPTSRDSTEPDAAAPDEEPNGILPVGTSPHGNGGEEGPKQIVGDRQQ
jgi:hypothetical protein